MQRFGESQAQDMIAGLVTSCGQVGVCIHSDALHSSGLMKICSGITIKDNSPIVKWENGQGNISEVSSPDCFSFGL
jgi:hypothetical protein